MMMKMLEAGGIEVVTDNVRAADEDNPKGYYEFEKVKKLKEDSSWLPEIKGKAVKMASELLYDLPDDYQYKLIFMRRDIDEILASQRKMLKRQGKEDSFDDAEMKAVYTKHLDEITKWLNEKPNMEVLYINYNQTISDPQTQAEKIEDFLGEAIQIKEMVSVVDESLYRNRKNQTVSEIKEKEPEEEVDDKEMIRQRLQALGYME
jgi:hypothetical protein